MYEVTTAIKTLLTTADKGEALEAAKEAAKTHNYVEVKHIVSTAPWYAKSIKTFKR